MSSIFLLGIASCKKDRVCRCLITTTTNQNGSSNVAYGNSETTLKKVNRQTGNSVCPSRTSIDSGYGQNGQYSTTESSCYLK